MSISEFTVWAYPWDIDDSGILTAVDDLVGEIGATDVAVAAMYHAGKFLLPHNPRRKVYFPRSGTRYFAPIGDAPPPLTVRTWDGARDNDFWRELRSALSERGVSLSAWCLGLHNSGLVAEHPECACVNAYGDVIATDLCANNPAVVDYLVASVGECVTATGAQRVLLESFEYMPFEHGFHHEVIGIPMPAKASVLLSLCFCGHCEAAAGEHGIDTAALRDEVRSLLDRWFDDPFAAAPSFEWSELKAEAGGALGAYLDMRSYAVTRLVERVSGAARAAGARVALVDFGPLYASGPDGSRWQSGLDLDAVAPFVDELHPTFYAADLASFDASVQSYLSIAPDAMELHGALRAIPPQATNESELKARVEKLNGRFTGVSFYNYGFMARPAFGWVSRAIEGVR